MKKNLFSILLILFIFFTKLFSQNCCVVRSPQTNTFVKGKIISIDNDSITIFNSNNYNVIIKGKYKDLKKGDYIKIFLDKNGNIIKIKKINLKVLRERIKKMCGKKKQQRMGCGCRLH